jgi:hypothetical protein
VEKIILVINPISNVGHQQWNINKYKDDDENIPNFKVRISNVLPIL